MTKARVNRIYRDELERWHDAWDAYWDGVFDLMGWDAFELLRDFDGWEVLPASLSDFQAKRLNVQQIHYARQLCKDLGLEFEAWAAWDRTGENRGKPDSDNEEPDLACLPKDLVLPPQDPRQALELTRGWTFPEDAPGFTRMLVVLYLAHAVQRWETCQRESTW